MTERRDLHTLREGNNARARSECPADVVIDREPDREPNGVCMCCGKWKFIPPMMHVCLPCWRDES